ncbi:MAG: LPS export ABC transporter permease LptF [Desulfovermiculus sp.]|nr:LPS export ABC transporter permease LptF [Desulfovermiculus sp.]
MLVFKRLYRENLRELISIGCMCLAVFVALLLVGKMLRLRHLLVTMDLSLLDIGALFFYLTPFFLMLLIPVAGMISMFVTFQRMSGDRELMALRAGGISLSQILPAPCLFLLLCAGLTLFISLHGVSWGMERFEHTILDLAKNKAQLSLRPGVFNRDFPGLVVYARNVDRESGEMKDIFIHDTTHAEKGVIIVAPQGKVATDHSQGKVFFLLANGQMYRLDPESMDVLSFSAYRVSLNLSRLLQDVDVNRDKPRYMSWTELTQIVNRPEQGSEKKPEFLRTVQVERHKRWALPVACIVLGLVALPLGWILDEIKRQYGSILIVGIFLAYYAVFSLGIGFGQLGVLSPWVGAWSPNVLFMGLSAALFRHALHERGTSAGKRVADAIQGMIRR